MQFAILAPGSRGDVQPYIALGQGLVRVGHGVSVVTNRDHEALVRSHGLPVRALSIDVQAALRERETSRAIEGGGLIASFRKFAELAKQGARELGEVGLEAAKGADVIVAGFSGMMIGASLADKLRVPMVQALNVPLTPTSAFPGALFPWMSFWPRALTHRLSHWLTRQVIFQVGAGPTNAARTSVLGMPKASVGRILGAEVLRGLPLLYGLSEAVIPRPADWGSDVRMTGFWFAEEPADWAPPADLERFLASGSAPVYIGFGSMSTEAPEATMRLVLDAVARSGQRAIIHSGWAGLSAKSLPEGVLVVGSVPHSWLFSRVSAIVHHGGAGTTAAAFRAGAPQIVVPFHGDQPFWARVAHRIGAGTRPLPRTRLTSERLAHAIEEACSSEPMRETAARIGESVRREDGVTAAVEVLTRPLR